MGVECLLGSVMVMIEGVRGVVPDGPQVASGLETLSQARSLAYQAKFMHALEAVPFFYEPPRRHLKP